MDDEDFAALVRAHGLEALAASFPAELRAAAETAAAQRAQLEPVADPGVAP